MYSWNLYGKVGSEGGAGRVGEKADLLGEWLKSDEDVEYCCDRLLQSEVFQRESDKVRYELISIANEVLPPNVPGLPRILLEYRNWSIRT